ncbi:MAG: universal stress protein [Haloarculaceae archaeon]
MYDQILVPTDGSEPADLAVAEAIDLAAEADATLHALSVVDESPGSLLLRAESLGDAMEAMTTHAQDAVDTVAERAADRGVRTETAVLRGMSVAEAIVDYATDHDVDLIVMGTNGHHGVDVLLGSTTERVVAASPIPVLSISSAEKAQHAREAIYAGPSDGP